MNDTDKARTDEKTIRAAMARTACDLVIETTYMQLRLEQYRKARADKTRADKACK